MNKELEKYPKTDCFEVLDTMAVTHPYMITSAHVVYASDHFSGRLGKEAIRALETEKGKGMCGHPECLLRIDEHQTALVVGIRTKKDSLANVPGLAEYLQAISAMAEDDGMAGFAFKKLPLSDNADRATYTERFKKG